MKFSFHSSLSQGLPNAIMVFVADGGPRNGEPATAEEIDTLLLQLNGEMEDRPTQVRKCSACKGSGRIANPGAGNCEAQYVDCPDCHGIGKINA